MTVLGLLMAIIFMLIVGVTIVTFVRSLFGPHWMRSQLRSGVQEMQELSRELQSFAESARPRPEHSPNSACPACGAPVSNPADISPRGDVKCGHCGRWFSAERR